MEVYKSTPAWDIDNRWVISVPVKLDQAKHSLIYLYFSFRFYTESWKQDWESLVFRNEHGLLNCSAETLPASEFQLIENISADEIFCGMRIAIPGMEMSLDFPDDSDTTEESILESLRPIIDNPGIDAPKIIFLMSPPRGRGIFRSDRKTFRTALQHAQIQDVSDHTAIPWLL